MQSEHRATETPALRLLGAHAAVVLLLATSLVLASLNRARAHPILITTGTAEVQASALLLHLHIADQDIQHASGDPADLSAYQAQARELARTIAILDDHGSRLSVSEPSGQPQLTLVEDVGTQWPFDLRVTLPDDAAYITLQLRREDGAAPPRQIHLAYDAPDAKDSRTLRLTTGGNTEVICVNPSRAARDAESIAMGDDRFSRIILMPTINGRTLTLTVSAPLTMLQTWAAFPQAQTDQLDAESAKQWLIAAEPWFRAHLLATSGDQPLPVATFICEARNAQGTPIGTHDAKPTAFAAASLRAQFIIERPEARQATTLTWQGFNNAVQSVNAIISGAKPTHRELPSGSAVIAVSRSDTGEWTISTPSPTAR